MDVNLQQNMWLKLAEVKSMSDSLDDIHEGIEGIHAEVS